MKDWRERLRDLNINPEKVSQSLQEALDSPDREREIQKVRKEVARERPVVRAEIGEVKILPQGPVVFHVRFDPDEVEGAEVSSLRVNDVQVHVDGKRGWPSFAAADGRPQVEWEIQGHTADPEEARRLLRSTSYSLEGSLDGRRRFVGFGSKQSPALAGKAG